MRNIFKIFRFLAVWFLIMILSSSVSFAAGMMVSPGAFCLQNADIGNDLDLGIDLVITNTSDDEQTYIVRPLLPSQIKNNWLKGYSEIPDTSWFYFPTNKITVQKGQQGKLRMHLNIPDNEIYYNQHWIVYVSVTTETGSGEMFQTAINPNYMIETKSTLDINDKPYGITGLIPIIVKAQDVVLGKKRKVYFKIINNDNVTHTYTINPYIPNASAKQDISGSPGYEWIKDTDWINPSLSWFRPSTKMITLMPGEEKNVSLTITVPKGSSCMDQGWESIVFIEPDQGLAGFVRILIEPIE